MMALGWTLFFVAYFIGLCYVLATDIASYRGSLYPWRWKWILLAWPILFLSDIWDKRQAIYDSLTRKPAR